ncbi:hypothetical protein MOQ_003346 [Trypanosoma cruzi marinkellei]|uniref:Uncharacterized protein n=1 Tax=Trypanosoma cruzi marinkellei TaxID=85056 RepID=K2MC65_TRYCR|nr:hypothetical protein MOQ_003346 [Trypanosoma cruzi marinkellei]
MPRARSAAATVTTTADAFEADIVRLVRLQHIHTVELLSAAEETHLGAATSFSSSLPAIILVEARLTSTLTWQPDLRNRFQCAKTSKEDGSVFTYHITFLHPTDAVPEASPSIPFNLPQKILSAKWCTELQRRLAVCSALTGFPTRLCVSLLPYVPNLIWDRGRDGLLGATHSTTMMSSPAERSVVYSDGEFAAEQLVRVAILLNANIPLGPRGGRNTAVLLLHATDGDLCSLSSSSSSRLLTSEEGRKRQRELTLKSERLKTYRLVEKEPFFPLLSRFSEAYILPRISWEAVWSSPMQMEKDSGHDVCGLREELGCSFYLEGSLDAQSVQSITVIVDAPFELWRRAVYGDTPMGSSADNDFLRGFPGCIAKTIMGALSRLAAENIDCFRRRLTSMSIGVEGVKKEEEEEGEEEGASTFSAAAVPNPVHQSWSLLAQSIADSLAHIVRTSRNRVFVAEVHRLLANHQRDEEPQTACSDANSDPAVDLGSGAECSSPPLATTIALLRWAVETRLMEQ